MLGRRTNSKGRQTANAPAPRLRRAALALLCAFGLGTADREAAAAAPEPLLTRAQQLLDSGDATAALALLKPEQGRFAGNPEFDFRIGLAFYRTGQGDRALFALERVIMIDPERAEARQLLARLCRERGDEQSARELLSYFEGRSEKPQPAAQNTPAPAARTAIDGYVAAGIGWDGNVTSGPDTASVVIPALAVDGPTLLGKARQGGDGVALLSAGLSATHALSEGTWLTGSVNASQSGYQHRSDVNEGYGTVDLGAVARRGGETFSAGIFGQDYASGGALYRRTLGARFDWNHALDAGSSLTTYLRYYDFAYPAYPAEDADRGVLGVTHQLHDQGGWSIGYGLHAGSERTKQRTGAALDYRLAGVHLDASHRITDRLGFSAAMLAEARDFDAQNGLYLRTRADRQLVAAAALDYRLTGHWHLSPRLSYTRNQSSIDLFDYGRFAAILFLQWSSGHESD